MEQSTQTLGLTGLVLPLRETVESLAPLEHLVPLAPLEHLDQLDPQERVVTVERQ